MNLKPVTLERGEVYGSLVVLRKAGRNNRYMCGCKCGTRIFYAKARELMRGTVTKCKRC